MSSLDSDSLEPKEYRSKLFLVILIILLLLFVILIIYKPDIQLPFFGQHNETQNNSENPEQLLITSSESTVKEGTEFIVTVTAHNSPIEHAQVVFNTLSYFTDVNGNVILIAPRVDATTSYTITVNQDGYIPTYTTVTIIDAPTSNYGWIYGETVDTLGSPLIGVHILAQSSKGEINSTYTDAEGRYDLSLHEGTYTITARKLGYETAIVSNIIITENTAYEKKFILEKVQ